MAEETLMTADSSSVSKNISISDYGLYIDDALALKPDSFISYSYVNESRISQYPQEAGAFQQYNKVDTPFNVRVRMTKGGNVADVASFLSQVESLPKATNLSFYEVRTPERYYSSLNIEKISHEHTSSHGVNLLTVDINLVEIRVTASAQYSNTTSPTATGNLSNAKAPAATDPKTTGTVQPQAPTQTQQKAVGDALANTLLNAETIVP